MRKFAGVIEVTIQLRFSSSPPSLQEEQDCRLVGDEEKRNWKVTPTTPANFLFHEMGARRFEFGGPLRPPQGTLGSKLNPVYLSFIDPPVSYSYSLLIKRSD